MTHYKHLIIGGGMTAAAAVEGIRESDPDGAIGADQRRDRPALQPPAPLQGALEGRPDPRRHLDRPAGARSHPAPRPHGPDARPAAPARCATTPAWPTPMTSCCWPPAAGPAACPSAATTSSTSAPWPTTPPACALDGDRRPRFAVIGGGFIGIGDRRRPGHERQAASSCSSPSPRIGGRMYPPDLAEFLNDYYRQKGGRTCCAGARVTGVRRRAGGPVVDDDRGDHRGRGRRRRRASASSPTIALAQAAGLEVDDGILVDECLRTSAPDIYAAGDVANFYDPRPGPARAWSTKTTPTRWAGWRAGRWPGGAALRPPALLLLRPVRAGLRGGRRGGRPAGDVRRLAGALPRGRGLLPARRPGARRAALERLGAGGRGPRADRRARPVHRRRPTGPPPRASLTARPAARRLRRGGGRRASAWHTLAHPGPAR